MKSYRIPRRYTAGQLVRLAKMCKTESLKLTVEDWAGDTVYTSQSWLAWFFEKLTQKINRNEPARGKGNAARRRAEAIADRKAECKWCGSPTGQRNRRFCDPGCARAYCS